MRCGLFARHYGNDKSKTKTVVKVIRRVSTYFCIYLNTFFCSVHVYVKKTIHFQNFSGEGDPSLP